MVHSCRPLLSCALWTISKVVNFWISYLNHNAFLAYLNHTMPYNRICELVVKFIHLNLFDIGIPSMTVTTLIDVWNKGF